MARILGYIAASLDGRIATADDRLEWLFKYNDMKLGDHSADAFLARMAAVVMGRGTYDFLAREIGTWPYAGKRAFVVTSRPVPAPMGPLEIRSDIDDLVAELRAFEGGDVWMVGGGRLQMAFLERGALDEIEIYIVPELVGSGPFLFPATGFSASPRLLSAQEMDMGCVRLHYSFT